MSGWLRNRHGLPRLLRASQDEIIGDVTPPSIIDGPYDSDVTETTAKITWYLDEFATGQVEYGTTVAYGSTTTGEFTYDWDHHIQTISGLSAGTLYHYRVVGEDEAGNPYTSADNTFTTLGATIPSSGRWGAGYSSCTLANTMCWVGENPIAHSFRAAYTSNIVSLRMWYMNQPGYGKGSPVFDISIQTDDGSANNYPSGTAVAAVSSGYVDTTGGSQDTDRLFTLTTPAPVTAGNLYHAVFTNRSSDTTNNYFSFDGNWGAQPYGGYTPTRYDGRWNPMVADNDWAVLQYKNGAWSRRNAYWPIMEITYSSGDVQGLSYWDVLYSPGTLYDTFPLKITGATYVRQRFYAPAGGLSVSGAGVRLSKLSSSSADLTVDLQNSSRVSQGSFTLAASTFPNGTGAGVEDAPDWGAGTFGGAPLTLTAGNLYFLELRTTSSSTFYARGNRKDHPGYDDRTFFGDRTNGYHSCNAWCEASANSGSTWSGGTRLWSASNPPSRLADLQFFLDLA